MWSNVVARFCEKVFGPHRVAIARVSHHKVVFDQFIERRFQGFATDLAPMIELFQSIGQRDEFGAPGASVAAKKFRQDRDTPASVKDQGKSMESLIRLGLIKKPLWTLRP